MSPLLIRASALTDLPALVNLTNLVWPEFTTTLQQEEFKERTRDPTLVHEMLVAEQDGPVCGMTRFKQLEGAIDTHLFVVTVEVHPDAQGRGIGAALYDALWKAMQPHQPTTLMCGVFEDRPASMHFAARRGFVEVDRGHLAELQLDQLNTSRREAVYEQAHSVGYDLVTFDRYAEQVGEDTAWTRMHALEVDALRDLPLAPGDSYEVPPLERYREVSSSDPRFDASLWFVAVKGTEIAAASQLMRSAIPGAMDINLTMVARAHRGQKLAWALKYLALEEAARRETDRVRTTNNARNAPMRHINIELGFLPLPAYLGLQRKLEPEA